MSNAKKIIAALVARNVEVNSRDTEIAIKYCESSAVAIDACLSKPEFKEIANRLIKNMRIADKNQDKENFVAVKVCVKIVRVLCAIGQGLNAEIDNHTKILGYQLAKLQELTNKSMMVAQSKRAVYSEIDRVQELDFNHRSNYSLNTADTQMSSTRMMFNYLGMCDVIKNKRNDVIVIQDNDRARAFIALFAK